MAQMLTVRALHWLTATKKPRLLHAFDHVCNWVNERGEVLALQTAALPLGPLSWQVPQLPALAADVQIRLDASVCRLQVDTAVFCWHNEPLWQAIPAWERLRERPFLPPTVPLTTSVQQRWSAYLAAVEAGGVDEMVKTAVGLAGLGTGLTPTADDLLVGSLHALWVMGAPPAWMGAISEATAPRTTTLSASFLRAAGAGEASALWHALADGQTDAIRQICAVGNRSGRESWLGFCQTLHSLRTSNELRCGS